MKEQVFRKRERGGGEKERERGREERHTIYFQWPQYLKLRMRGPTESK